MLIFLHGEDHFLVDRRRRALQAAFVKKYSGVEVLVFDFEDDRSGEALRRALQSGEPGLFVDKKMVVFLHPLEVSEGEKALIDFFKKSATEKNEALILLVVHAGKVKKTAPLAKALLKYAGTVDTVASLDDHTRRAFVKKELSMRDSQAVLNGEALELFLSSVGDDTARLSQELEKLSLHKKESRITSEDVALLLSPPEEDAVFDALAALVQGNKKHALALLRRESRKSDSIYGILALSAWQVRKLLIIREAYDGGRRRAADIASTAKLPPFVVEKNLRFIENFSPERLKKGLVLLSDLDVQMKQGATTPELALDLFLWKF